MVVLLMLAQQQGQDLLLQKPYLSTVVENIALLTS